jgi:hypothetical protein
MLRMRSRTRSRRTSAPHTRAAGLTVRQVVAATWQRAGVAGFFAGNLADVIRTAPQKSVQLAACALLLLPARRLAFPR